MSEENERPITWGYIIGVMLGVAILTGLILGALGSFFGLSGGGRTAGVGASTGLIGALLMAKRSAQLAKNNPPNP